MTEATAAPAKATIRPNIANMVKTKGGSYHKDDFIGTTLAGLTVAQLVLIASNVGIDTAKYGHLNPGQIRMTLGNKLRALCAEANETGLEGAALDKAVAANVESEKIRDAVEDMANEMKADGAEAKAEAEKAKEEAKAQKAAAAAEAKAQKAAAKEAKAKAKIADDANGEGDTKD